MRGNTSRSARMRLFELGFFGFRRVP